MLKIDVIRQHDVSHKSAGLFDGCDSFNFVLCASKKVLWYRQSVDKGRCGVICLGAVTHLLFRNIVMKIVFNRLPDAFLSYSVICDNSKGFDFVVCEFGLGVPILSD